MRRLLVMAAVGLVAQLVDGSMGMAYGVTSTTLMLQAGLAPVVASASVHLAELVTTALSGLSHWRFGNVHWPLVWAIALPGGLGAFAGAAFLSSLPVELARPYVALFLLGLGLVIPVRFLRERPPASTPPPAPSKGFLPVLGLVAGFADAVGGGGWGPIATPTLLARRHLQPRTVVGSVDAAEFLVAASATAGFWVSAPGRPAEPAWVVALIIGGSVAAPLAAWFVSRVPPRVLGVAVGGMVVLVNSRVVLGALGAPPGVRAPVYGLMGLVALAAVAWVLGRRWASRLTDAAGPRLPAGRR